MPAKTRRPRRQFNAPPPGLEDRMAAAGPMPAMNPAMAMFGGAAAQVPGTPGLYGGAAGGAAQDARQLAAGEALTSRPGLAGPPPGQMDAYAARASQMIPRGGPPMPPGAMPPQGPGQMGPLPPGMPPQGLDAQLAAAQQAQLQGMPVTQLPNVATGPGAGPAGRDGRHDAGRSEQSSAESGPRRSPQTRQHAGVPAVRNAGRRRRRRRRPVADWSGSGRCSRPAGGEAAPAPAPQTDGAGWSGRRAGAHGDGRSG